MNVMLVCSVSTLVFNANPLLRYDGYYVLADLCDVPNLAERSRALLASQSNKWLFGVDEPTTETLSGGGRFWMLTYAVLATLYRWGLTLMILWLVSLILRPYGLESIGRVLCLFAVCGLLFALLRRPARFLKNPARRRMIRIPRTALSLAWMGALIMLAFVPLPSWISANARIIPRQETPIYVSTSGLVTSVAASPGQLVRKGDPIATLANPDVELQYLVARGRVHTQQGVVELLRKSQLDVPEVSSELPAAESLLEDLRQQLQTRRSRRAGLTIVAPAGGRLIAAAKRPIEPDNEFRMPGWSGYATDQENRYCFVEPGWELMSVAADDDWDAEVLLPQSDVHRFEVGAVGEADLPLGALPACPRHGHRHFPCGVDA